jgi:hypothetical protein
MENKKININDFIGGWFIGNFTPSLLQTSAFEVAIKKYKKGDYEKTHLHKIAKEFTVIVTGVVKMNNVIYNEGEIVIINENVATDFEAITDTITLVVKTPSVTNDKYII